MMFSIKNKAVKLKFVYFFFLLALVTGCSGGGESTGQTEINTVPPTGGISGTGIMLEGTVQKNRLFAVNQVQARTRDNQIVLASIGDNGQFSFSDLPDSPPYLLKVDFVTGAPFYALTYAQNGRQNIHAYSDLLVRNWYGAMGREVSDVFDGTIDSFPTSDQLQRQSEAISNLTVPVLAEYGLAETDLSTVQFLADDRGIDDFLDNNPVIIVNGDVNIVITNPVTNFQTSITSGLSLETDLTLQDVTQPNQPERLRALTSEELEIVLAWDASEDNVGVSEYEILREGVVIATSTFPFYIDTTVVVGGVYRYSIVAIDSSGNRSIASDSASADVRLDVTSPPAPEGLTIVPTGDTLRLSWDQRSIADVSSFMVLFGSDVVANTTSTFAYLTDITSGTEYCYQVVAVDGSNNASDPSAITCTSTSQPAPIVGAIETVEEANIVGSWGGMVSGDMGDTLAIFNIVAAADGMLSGNYQFPTIPICDGPMTFVLQSNQTYEFIQNRRYATGDCRFNARINFTATTVGSEQVLEYQYYDPNDDTVSRTGTLSRRSVALNDLTIGSWGGIFSSTSGDIPAIFNITATADGSLSGDYQFPTIPICDGPMTFVLKSDQTYDFIQNRRYATGDCRFNARVNFTVSTIGSEQMLEYQYYDPNDGAVSRSGTLSRRSVALNDLTIGSWGGIVTNASGDIPAIFNIAATADGSLSGDYQFPTIPICDGPMTFVLKSDQTYDFIQNRRYATGDCRFNARVNFTVSTDGSEQMLDYKYYDPSDNTVSQVGTLSRR